MSSDDPKPHVWSHIEGGVGEIVIDRPDAMNALSPSMVDGLIAITRRFEADARVRAVLIRATGENFMAGGDVKGFHDSLTNNREAHLAGMEQRVVTGHLAIHRLRRMHKPVLVAVQGAAAGFGLSLLLAADLAIAADNAYFILAYRHIGLTVDGGASYFLPRIVGERRALELALLGERLVAAKALDWGILNWTCPAADLATRSRAIAEALAAGPTEALGRAKQLFRNSLQSSWDEQSAREAENIAAVIGTADHLEGVTAFMEKRKARFGDQDG